ncbi:Uncharacterised protein [Vibrio cholerae]|nr:Uncharacterised protein [Vibrio cholerae]
MDGRLVCAAHGTTYFSFPHSCCCVVYLYSYP